MPGLLDIKTNFTEINPVCLQVKLISKPRNVNSYLLHVCRDDHVVCKLVSDPSKPDALHGLI